MKIYLKANPLGLVDCALTPIEKFHQFLNISFHLEYINNHHFKKLNSNDQIQQLIFLVAALAQGEKRERDDLNYLFNTISNIPLTGEEEKVRTALFNPTTDAPKKEDDSLSPKKNYGK